MDSRKLRESDAALVAMIDRDYRRKAVGAWVRRRVWGYCQDELDEAWQATLEELIEDVLDGKVDVGAGEGVLVPALAKRFEWAMWRVRRVGKGLGIGSQWEGYAKVKTYVRVKGKDGGEDRLWLERVIHPGFGVEAAGGEAATADRIYDALLACIGDLPDSPRIWVEGFMELFWEGVISEASIHAGWGDALARRVSEKRGREYGRKSAIQGLGKAREMLWARLREMGVVKGCRPKLRSYDRV